MGALLRRRYMGGNKEVVDTRIIATFIVTNDSATTKILYSTSGITSVEIDGAVQTVATNYQLSVGSHEVKIGLSNNTVTPQYMFNGCTTLHDVVLPSTIQTLGSGTFQNLSAFYDITCYAVTPPVFDGSIFRYTTIRGDIYVPAESVDTYKAASGWSTYARKIQAIPT